MVGPARADGPIARIHTSQNRLHACQYRAVLPRAARPAATASHPLAGLRILDIGCGGGLLAEPMARLGGTVTGIDVTEVATTAAAQHATQVGLNIEYRCCPAEELASTGATFDVIYASEVIEHVADRGLFIRAIAQC